MLSSFIAVDTETTGLDFEHDRVIELAAVRFEGGQPVAVFEALLSPGDRSLSPVSRLITGIGDEELQAAPPAADSLRAFLEFAGDLPLVAHNAEFDAHFVRRTLEAEGLPPLTGPWLDSLLLSRIAWPDWESHRLDSLAERLAVPREAEHRALPDARRAGFVFCAAQAYVRTHVTDAAWTDLSRLAADLPDWSLVFDGAERDRASASSPDRDTSASTPVPAAATADDEASDLIVREVSGALSSGEDHALVLETPPGVDESVAALRAAMEAAGTGKRVLVAVPDTFAWNALRKSAERAAVTDSPGLRTARLVTLAEPSGYLSRARLKAITENPARVPRGERASLLPLVAWADREPSRPVVADRGFSPERARLTWSRVCCDSWADDPGARAAREAAATAGVIVVTHATLCAHVALEGALLPACDAVIVTGAHRFPETAQSAVGAGRSVTFFRLRETLLLLRSVVDSGNLAEPDGGLWGELAPHLPEGERAGGGEAWFEPEHQLQKFLQKAGRHAAKQRPQGDFRVRYTEPVALAFGVNPEPVLESLREKEAFLDKCLDHVNGTANASFLSGELRRIQSRLRAFRSDFEALCDLRDEDAVYWFEDVSNPHKASLRMAPRNMTEFGDAMGSLFGTSVFLAPALISGSHTSRDARWFLRAAGLDAAEVPVEVRRLPDSRPPQFLMTPFSPALAAGEQTEVFARFVAEAAQPFLLKGVLVFCPSQTALRALHAALRRVLANTTVGATADAPVPLWAQHVDGNRDAILRLFAAGRGGIVLAAEGLAGLRDADGNAPALWIITRMPLPSPHEPLLEARGETLREEGKNARLELWHPAAVLRLKREWATLKKGGSPGPGVVWLLDARAATEGLGARMAAALGSDAITAKNLEALREKTTASSTTVQQYNNENS